MKFATHLEKKESTWGDWPTLRKGQRNRWDKAQAAGSPELAPPTPLPAPHSPPTGPGASAAAACRLEPREPPNLRRLGPTPSPQQWGEGEAWESISCFDNELGLIRRGISQT